MNLNLSDNVPETATEGKADGAIYQSTVYQRYPAKEPVAGSNLAVKHSIAIPVDTSVFPWFADFPDEETARRYSACDEAFAALEAFNAWGNEQLSERRAERLHDAIQLMDAAFAKRDGLTNKEAVQ